MNRVELVGSMSEKSGLSKKDAELALKAFIDSVEDTVASGEKVALVGFVTFESRDVAAKEARKGRNPRTGEEINIEAKPATKSVGVKIGKAFKDKVKNAK